MRKLIEQMLDCIEELRYSNTTHAADTICDSAITAAREYLAQPEQSEPVEQCTESDSWNCKYCRKTETCKALQDPRNFGKPKAPEPLTDTRCKVKLGEQYGSDLAGHWFFLQPADEFADKVLEKHSGIAAQRGKE